MTFWLSRVREPPIAGDMGCSELCCRIPSSSHGSHVAGAGLSPSAVIWFSGLQPGLPIRPVNNWAGPKIWFRRGQKNSHMNRNFQAARGMKRYEKNIYNK